MGADVLNQFFKGPGSTEYYSYGWRAIYHNGFTGYTKVEFSGDTVRRLPDRYLCASAQGLHDRGPADPQPEAIPHSSIRENLR